ncbi:MAG TPA: helix-hairpin-helix domain-containing protein [Gemmatimonadales bacterium]|nr:helix-hairpin-helix domain-containing protein [Gemmatimonadales bacterium]
MVRPEHRAALLLLGLAVAGQAARTWLSEPGEPPGEARLLSGGPPRGVEAHRDSAARASSPLGTGELVDLDRASLREILRIPHLGPSLARAIVADRNARGPFGDLTGLDRVAGVGPGLLRAIAPHVRFSGTPRPASPSLSLDPPPVLQRSTADCHWAHCGSSRLDLNVASAAQLERLPGIGPSLASRIVVFRGKHGPFASVDDLVRVGGIGPATLQRVRDRVEVKPFPP